MPTRAYTPPAVLFSLCAALLAGACGGDAEGRPSSGGDEAGTPGPAAARPSGEGARGTSEAARPGPAAGTAWVIFGADTVVAEVAQSEEERAQGLMYRESLAEDAGMLFVFPDDAVRSFWMENTYIALDIAFMDPGFRVVDIQQMEPMTTVTRWSRAPAMYALEVNQGWFQAHGVEVGAVAEVRFGR